jgi:hypothetical protein
MLNALAATFLMATFGTTSTTATINPADQSLPDLHLAQSSEIEVLSGIVVLCSTFTSIQTLHAILEATGRDAAVEGCWDVSTPVRVVIIEEGGPFSSVTYWEPGPERWYPGAAYTVTAWLRN